MQQKYERVFEQALTGIHTEGRYRVFADIMRSRGQFPRARLRQDDGSYRDIIVWCSNDYLGQAQHGDVLAAAHEAIDAVGAGAGGTRNISGTTSYHVDLERELAALHGKDAALLFTSGYVSNEATLSTLANLFPTMASVVSAPHSGATMSHAPFSVAAIPTRLITQAAALDQ